MLTGGNLLTILEHRTGLPIGNLTSQWFANLYLDNLDHFIKEQLRINAYLRYVDDFALFSNDYNQLKAAKLAIETHLEQLRLRLHPIKSQLFATSHGASFLGFRVFPRYIRVRNESLQRGMRRLRMSYMNESITWPQVAQSLQSWNAHLAHGDTWRLREQIFARTAFVLKSTVG